MQSKLDKLRVGAMLNETTVTETGQITVKGDVVCIDTRKPGSTRLLQKIIPITSVISMEIDRENRGKIIYRVPGGEIAFKGEYKPTKSVIPGFVAMAQVIEDKKGNKTLPTVLHVRSEMFTSVYESVSEDRKKSSDKKKKDGKAKDKEKKKK